MAKLRRCSPGRGMSSDGAPTAGAAAAAAAATIDAAGDGDSVADCIVATLVAAARDVAQTMGCPSTLAPRPLPVPPLVRPAMVTPMVTAALTTLPLPSGLARHGPGRGGLPFAAAAAAVKEAAVAVD